MVVILIKWDNGSNVMIYIPAKRRTKSTGMIIDYIERSIYKMIYKIYKILKTKLH